MGRRRRIIVTVVLGVAVIAVAGLVPALVAAAAALGSRHWRWLPAALVVALGTVVAGAVIGIEWRRDYPADPDWPSRFGWTSPLTWSAVAIVVVMAIVPRLWPDDGRRWPRRRSSEQ
jgi:hypothetical protein